MDQLGKKNASAQSVAIRMLREGKTHDPGEICALCDLRIKELDAHIADFEKRVAETRHVSDARALNSITRARDEVIDQRNLMHVAAHQSFKLIDGGNHG